MKGILIRIAGIALIVAGIAGLIFALLGFVILARVEPQVEAALMEQVDLLHRSLTATADGLAVAKVTLAQASNAAGALDATLSGIGQAVDGTIPTLDAVASLLGEKLPATLEATKGTLESVASTAKGVDDFLAAITSIRLLGMEPYDPDVTLHQGIADVASSLEGIPQSLWLAQEGLASAGDSLEGMSQEFDDMAGDVHRIAASLENAHGVIDEYQGVVADLMVLVGRMRQGLPTWLRWLRVGMSFFLVWLAVAQLALITQGWELMRRDPAKTREVSDTAGEQPERAL